MISWFADNIQLRDVVLLFVGTILAFVAAAFGAWLQRRVDRAASNRPINQILSFNKSKKVLIAYPHRELIEPAYDRAKIVSYLPRTSTEDFIAINNIISALINIDWHNNSVRSTQPQDGTAEVGIENFKFIDKEDLRNNLVVICSPKSNPIAYLIQEELVKQRMPVFRLEADDDESKRYCVVDKNGAKYHSPTYDQEEEYLREGIDANDLANQKFEDWAVVTKCANPWNPNTKAMLVSGIRGIGTWAAAECLKKSWSDIHKKLPKEEKDHDFSALLHVYYEGADITLIVVERVETLG